MINNVQTYQRLIVQSQQNQIAFADNSQHTINIIIPAFSCIDLRKSNICLELTYTTTADHTEAIFSRADIISNLITSCTVSLDSQQIASYQNLSLSQYLYYYMQKDNIKKDGDMLVQNKNFLQQNLIALKNVGTNNVILAETKKVILSLNIKHFLPFLFFEDELQINQQLHISLTFHQQANNSCLLVQDFEDERNPQQAIPAGGDAATIVENLKTTRLDYQNFVQKAYTHFNFFAELFVITNKIAPQRQIHTNIVSYQQSGAAQILYNHSSIGLCKMLAFGYFENSINVENSILSFPQLQFTGVADEMNSYIKKQCLVTLQGQTLINVSSAETSLVSQFQNLSDQEQKNNTATCILETNITNQIIQLQMSEMKEGNTALSSFLIVQEVMQLQENRD